MQELNQYPQPAILAANERLEGLNDKAAALFPELTQGSSLPEALCAPDEGESWEGCITLAGRMYRIAATVQGEQILYLFQPREQQVLGEAQMDGALYQVRTLMGQFHRELAPYVAGERESFQAEDLEQFSKSYYRMLRLMDHMDLLRDAAAGQLRPERQSLELDRLCMQIAMECGALLKEQGVEVDYRSGVGSVFVAGDEELLRSAILELISNCAKRRRSGGIVKLRLSKKGTWVRICVTDDGPPATNRERMTLTTRGAMPLIPTADMGAGLGLSAAETIVQMHGGALMISTGDHAPSVYLALPTQQPGENLSLHAPRPVRNMGMNPYLIALSDVLSGAVIREDWKE